MHIILVISKHPGKTCVKVDMTIVVDWDVKTTNQTNKPVNMNILCQKEEVALPAVR